MCSFPLRSSPGAALSPFLHSPPAVESTQAGVHAMTTRPTCRVSMGLLLAASIGCGPVEDAAERRPGVTTQPIMNGTFDPGDPATVLIGGGGGWSTGALVSPRVILTCGHCVDPQGEPRSFVYFGSS